MSTTKHFRFARFLKGLTDFLFWLMIFVCLGLAIWIAIVPLILPRTDLLISASIPVRIGGGADLTMDVQFQGSPNDPIESAIIQDAEGTLILETKSYGLMVLANLAKLIMGGGLLLIFHLLRGIVHAISIGEPFTLEVSRKIRGLGYAVLAMSFFGPLAQYIAAKEVINRMNATVPILNPGPTYDAMFLFLALLILLLAYVWSHGIELEGERALTI